MIRCRDYGSILPLTPKELHRITGFIEEDANGCWVWMGRRNSEGYGQIHLRKAYWFVHRLMYEFLKGPVKPGDVVDHLCGNKACCNPDHLDAVSQSQNLKRRLKAPRRFPRWCSNGHMLEGRNIGWTTRRGKRVMYCKACRAEKNRRYYAKRRLRLTASPAPLSLAPLVARIAPRERVSEYAPARPKAPKTTMTCSFKTTEPPIKTLVTIPVLNGALVLNMVLGPGLRAVGRIPA